MNSSPASRKQRISTWEELIDAINTPRRYPRFPELTPTGHWRPWNAEPAIQLSKFSSVKQPVKGPSSSGHLILNETNYARPLLYRPLQNGHIRLLDLHDARMQDNVLIGFKLMTVPLSLAPKYEALSYCWGSMDLCTGIFLSTQRHGKKVLRVTENLATFLHSALVVERPAEDRLQYLWVDQICIGQENVEERNAQVRRMAEIYKTATSVIVWLGQSTDFNLDNVNITINADLHMDWKGRLVQDWILEWAVFGRPWFFRQWVFQEAVFAQHISFLTGTVLMSMESLKKLRVSLDEFVDLDHKQRFAYDYEFHLILNQGFLVWIELTVKHLIQDDNIGLEQLLFYLNTQHSYDPRDKVFSLIGVVGNILPIDFVDYDQPVETIFQNLTRHLIESSGSLNVITYSGIYRLERRPTWVVLWYEPTMPKFTLEFDTSTSINRRWKPSSPVIANQLVASGKLIDSIATEIESFHISSKRFLDKRFATVLRQPFYDACACLNHAIESESNEVPPGCIVSNDERDVTVPGSDPNSSRKFTPAAFTRFFRTVFLGKEETESDFETLVQCPNHDQSLPRLDELMRWGVHRLGLLFVLRSGRFGFVKNPSQGPRAGDSIAILHGLDIPCILRKSEDGEGWLFISDIYIHDIMHGEGKHGCPHHCLGSY